MHDKLLIFFEILSAISKVALSPKFVIPRGRILRASDDVPIGDEDQLTLLVDNGVERS